MLEQRLWHLVLRGLLLWFAAVSGTASWDQGDAAGTNAVRQPQPCHTTASHDKSRANSHKSEHTT